MNPNPAPTPYENVNQVLRTLLAEIESALGQPLTGMYLYGSLALGGYDPASSDIDFWAVTQDALSKSQFDALGAMHARLAASGPLSKPHQLEGCYMPRADLRRFAPDSGPYPAWGEEGFHLFIPGGDWILQRHILREHPVIVSGPPPRDLIDPVSPDDLRWGVSDVLQGWWISEVDNPILIGRATVMRVFAVQTMCRALYTLEQGDVISKPAALRWAIDTLPDPWRALAAQASRWREGMPFASLAETLALVRHTVERSRAFRVLHTEPKYNLGGIPDPR